MKILSILPIFKKYHTLNEITLEHEGKEIKLEQLQRKNAVAALVYDTINKEFIFVAQWRPGRMDYMVEIPAGVIDTDEDSMTALNREIEEEIGYKIDKTILLMNDYFVSPGYSTEKIKIYYCEVSEKIGEGGGLATEDENIEIIKMNKNEFLQYQFNDGKSIIAKLTFVYHLNCMQPKK